MIIAAITENNTQQQLMTFFPGAGVEWRIIQRVEPVPGADAYFDLDFVPEPARCEALSRLRPALVIVNAVTPTTKEIGYPFIRINGWPGFLERPVHELAIPEENTAAREKKVAEEDTAPEETRERLAVLYRQLGREYRLVPDEPGMISARILSAIINEAFYTWEAEVSTKEEIDTAMRLGTNYPLGPFEWGERIGLGQVAGLLGALSRTNPAYVPSAALLQTVEKIKI
ncbi:MAG TPA: 3-hydroxyacyl-CoA dehydrogenase family protein [Puia sp.]|jgi:3-hydroxybutyryl-CoA dehydrogenase